MSEREMYRQPVPREETPPDAALERIQRLKAQLVGADIDDEEYPIKGEDA